ncbi:ribonuclease H-like domain-containing protein [Tanacetum coccineum]|uniref:Ribonuclease H-like domain-containing protein n=1 Tax=Tanacetum coccineum TaxID=301880 RepID=A0ABQ5CKW9_9ASTR
MIGPCFNFAKGTCRFGELCRYVHDANARNSTNTNWMNSRGRGTNDTATRNDLLTKLLQQIGNLGVCTPTVSSSSNTGSVVAYHTGPTYTPGPTASPAYPLGFPPQPACPSYGLPSAQPTHQQVNIAHAAQQQGLGASSHLKNSINSLSEIFTTCMYPSISVGDGHSIPITNTGHSILPTPLKSLHLNNVLITPHIVKILISVRQFVCDNNCTIEFDAFGFSIKDFMTRRVLLRCDSTRDIYPVTAPSLIPHAFLVSQHTWLQRLGHPGGEVLRRLVSSNFISYNKEKPHILCHACQLGKHVRLLFVSSSTVISSYFDIIHSDV